MSANSLHYSYTDLQTKVAVALNWNPTPASWTTANNTHWGVINKEALQQVYYPEPLEGERSPHVWSWLRPRGSLTLNAPYSTGTVSSSSTTVTLSGGTWPTWAASADLWAGGERLSVASRSNGTTIVLDSAPTTALAADTYSLIQHEYDLPADFSGMASNAFVVRRDQQECGRIPLVTPGDLMVSDRSLLGLGLPSKAAIVPVAPTTTSDARWQVQFADPFPRDDLRLEYRYIASPPVLDGTTYVYHYGGVQLSHCVAMSYLDAAYRTVRDSGEYRGPFLTALRQAVMYDRANYAPHTFGYPAISRGRGERLDAFDYLNRRRAQDAGVTFESIGTV